MISNELILLKLLLNRERMAVLAENEETGCCKRFNPEPWNNKEIHFQDKLFLKDRSFNVFHIPLNYGRVMKRNMKKIEKAEAKTIEPLMLSDENSPWSSVIYIEVTKRIPKAEIVKITGNFLSKVFEGPYSNSKKWMVEMEKFVKDKGKKIKKLYFFYTTCPSCAKAYGKNYTVLLAEI